MKHFLLILLLLSFFGCTSDEEGDPVIVSNPDGGSTELPPLATRCGLIANGEFTSSPSGDQLEPVNVRVIDGDEVVVTRLIGDEAGNQQAIKLHGITNDGLSSFRENRARSIISQASSPNAFLVNSGCEFVFPTGGRGVFGQLFTAGGQNVNEILREAGAAIPVSQGCGDDALVGCYAGIEVQEQFSNDVVRRILWKPNSERDGNLVLLIGNSGITATVNGQDLEDTGFGNGFGSQNRATAPGGAFGSNITVNFFNSSSGLRLRLGNGEDSLIIPNGSERLELNF